MKESLQFIFGKAQRHENITIVSISVRNEITIVCAAVEYERIIIVIITYNEKKIEVDENY